MPVPVYTNSPIAAKPSGVTPKTAAPGAPSSPPPTTTTASPTSHQGSYPPAQPGAAPLQPTPAAAAHAYTSQPTRTSTIESGSPPPPQPGAVPSPPGASKVTIPPPPKSGETYQPPQPTAAPRAAAVPYPPQMSIPSPTASYGTHQRGTSTTSTTAAAPSAVYGGPGPQSLDHPPGYHQNVNASGLDRYQQAAIGQNRAASGGEFASDNPEGAGVWDAAKKWAQTTGEKIAAAETEVWKRINK